MVPAVGVIAFGIVLIGFSLIGFYSLAGEHGWI
jgi:hypothetical protein